MNKNVMSDFREIFYSKYVSTFKDIISPESSQVRKSDYAVYKKRFIPLIKDFPKDSEIIDLGCGSGYFLTFLLQEGYTNLYGIDISEEQIKKLRIRGIGGDVGNIFTFLETSSKKYDIIFALDIIEHFHKEELIPLFLGFLNLLNEGGKIIIHTPNGQSPLALQHVYGDLTHLTIFNPASLTQLLMISGFNSIQFYETGPTAKNIMGIIRSIFWKVAKMGLQSLQLIESGAALDILTQDFICTARK